MKTSSDYELGQVFHMFPQSAQFIAHDVHNNSEVLFHIIPKEIIFENSLVTAAENANKIFLNKHPSLCAQRALIYASVLTKPQLAIEIPVYRSFPDIELQLRDKGEYFTDTNFHKIAFGLSVALHYLHSIGITHGNFCKDCIYINDNNEPFLYGYGFLQCISNNANIFGNQITPPEYVEPFTCSERTDIFKFGYFLMSFLTTEPPSFTNPFPKFRKDIPKSLISLIESCIQKNSMKRPTFKEVSRKLGYDKNIFLKGTDLKAFKMYKFEMRKSLAKSGNDMAYGCFLCLNPDNSKDISKSKRRFTNASSKRNAYASYQLALLYCDSSSLKSEVAEALYKKYMKKAAKGDVAEALYEIGLLKYNKNINTIHKFELNDKPIAENDNDNNIDVVTNDQKNDFNRNNNNNNRSKNIISSNNDKIENSEISDVIIVVDDDSSKENVEGEKKNTENKDNKENNNNEVNNNEFNEEEDNNIVIDKSSFIKVEEIRTQSVFDITEVINEALSLMKKSADLDNLGAQMKLAEIAKKDGRKEESATFYKKAALNGSKKAQFIYYSLDNDRIDILKAAALQGSVKANLKLSSLSKKGGDIDNYVNYLKAAIQDGKSAIAMEKLGKYYLKNNMIDSSLRYYKQASQHQHSAKASIVLAKLFAYGINVEQDLYESVQYLRLAAKYGCRKAAKVDIAEIEVENDEDAITYFKSLANQHRKIGLLAIGRLYENGYRITQNLIVAVKCYIKATKYSSKGNDFIDRMISDNESEANNLNEYIRLYKYLAEKGNSSALYRLAHCYHSGKGVKKDVKVARNLYQLAADAGSTQASLMLIQYFQQDTIMAFIEPKDFPENNNNNINNNNGNGNDDNDGNDGARRGGKSQCCCQIVNIIMGLSKLSRFFPIIFSFIRLIQACSVTVNTGNNGGSAVSRFTEWALHLVQIVVRDWLKIEPLSASQEALFLSCVFTYLLTFFVYGFLYGIEWLIISLVGSAIYIPAGVGIAKLSTSLGVWLVVGSILALLVTFFLKFKKILTGALKIRNMPLRILCCALLSPFYLCFLCVVIINPKYYSNFICRRGMSERHPRMNIILSLLLSLCIIDLIVLLIVNLSTIFYIVTAVFSLISIIVALLLIYAHWEPTELAKSSSIFVMYCFHVMGQLFLLPCINLLCGDEIVDNVTFAFVTFFSVIVPLLSILVFSIFPMIMRYYFHPFFIRAWMENAVAVSSVLCDKLKARFFIWPSFEYIYRVVYAICAKKATIVTNIAVSCIGFVMFVAARPYMAVYDNILALGEPMVLIILNSVIFSFSEEKKLSVTSAVVLFGLTFIPTITAVIVYFAHDRKRRFQYMVKDMKHEIENAPVFSPKQIYDENQFNFGKNDFDDSSELSFMSSSSEISEGRLESNRGDNNEERENEANKENRKTKKYRLYDNNLPFSVRLENYLTKKLSKFKNFQKLCDKTVDELVESDFGDQKFIHRRYDKLTISFYRYLNALIVSIGYILLYALITTWYMYVFVK